MRINTKDELKEKLWEITLIFLFADETFKTVEFLSSKEAKSVNNNFWQHTLIVNWRITVIELIKLLSKDSKNVYDLNSFLRDLQKENIFNIPNDKFTEWNELLKSKKTPIKNLKLQRNKVYAHTDEDSGTIRNDVSLSTTKEILDIIFQIISEINEIVLEKSLIRTPINSILDELKQSFKLITNYNDERNKMYAELEKLINMAK